MLACILFFAAVLPASSLMTLKGVTAAKPTPILGDYAGEIREQHPRKDGFTHVDTPRLIRRLQDVGVNTYFYLIWHASSDWDDLRKEFLPAAQKAGIDVWVYLVPPSEAREKRSEPYGTDYVAWMRAIGHLSRSFPNLKGMVMDDFNHNLSVFTPEYVKQMREAGQRANPAVRFYPQIYHTAIRPPLLQQYRGLFDGIVMTYRDGIYRNTQRTQRLQQQITKTSRLLKREGVPFVLMVHASKLSATPANPSTRYVDETLRAGLHHLGKEELQGVVTYALQKNWFPESNDHLAKVGYGYGCLFVPPGSHPPAGGFGELKQVVFPDRTSSYRLRFYQRVIAPARLPVGQYMQEIRIDGKKVWSQDAATASRKGWQRQELDLTPWLKEKPEAVLQLRLTRKRTGSPTWLFAGFDHMESQGFQLESPEFESSLGWSAYANHSAIIGDTLIYDPQRRMRVFLNAMALYRGYRWQEEVSSILPERWQEQQISFRDHLLQGRSSQALLFLDELMQPLKRNPQGKKLVEEGQLLKHLLTTKR